MVTRREFLGSVSGGLAAWSLGPTLASGQTAAQQPSVVGPDSLFLTWQRDPTTTMTIQWIASEATTTVQYSAGSGWLSAAARTKTYPDTDLRVHRCELTGLTPDTEYQFKLADSVPPLRFRTMPARQTDTIV